MTTEIWRDFDPNLDIPIGLKNARVTILPDRDDVPDPNADIDFQTETYIDEESELGEEEVGDELDVPGTFFIVSQLIRTAPDGSQVVDVVIDVEEVEGAIKYEVRITK